MLSENYFCRERKITDTLFVVEKCRYKFDPKTFRQITDVTIDKVFNNRQEAKEWAYKRNLNRTGYWNYLY